MHGVLLFNSNNFLSIVSNDQLLYIANEQVFICIILPTNTSHVIIVKVLQLRI